jgi:hypothetical protein
MSHIVQSGIRPTGNGIPVCNAPQPVSTLATTLLSNVVLLSMCLAALTSLELVKVGFAVALVRIGTSATSDGG